MGKLADAIRGVHLPTQKHAQLLRLDVEYVEMESQLASFQQQNSALEDRNRKLQEKNKTLEDRVSGLQAQFEARTASKEKNVVHDELDEVEQTFLSYLASMKRSENRTTRKVADAILDVHPETEMTELKARVYLKRLEKRELVQFYPSGYSYSSTPEHWDLTDRGAECVVVHKLEHGKSSHSPAADALEAAEIEMMKFIGSKKSAPAEDIGKGLNMTSVAVEHFLGRMLKAHFLIQHPGVGGLVAAHYSLADKGNAYLVENKIVPIAAAQPNNPRGHHCDHCGSNQLRRTGSRPDAHFAAVGIKQAMYSCIACGKESAFTNDES